MVEKFLRDYSLIILIAIVTFSFFLCCQGQTPEKVLSDTSVPDDKALRFIGNYFCDARTRPAGVSLEGNRKILLIDMEVFSSSREHVKRLITELALKIFRSAQRRDFGSLTIRVTVLMKVHDAGTVLSEVHKRTPRLREIFCASMDRERLENVSNWDSSKIKEEIIKQVGVLWTVEFDNLDRILMFKLKEIPK